MRDCWSDRSDGEDWHPYFTRFLYDWEVDDADRPLMKLGQHVVVPEEEDLVFLEFV